MSVEDYSKEAVSFPITDPGPPGPAVTPPSGCGRCIEDVRSCHGDVLSASSSQATSGVRAEPSFGGCIHLEIGLAKLFGQYQGCAPAVLKDNGNVRGNLPGR